MRRAFLSTLGLGLLGLTGFASSADAQANGVTIRNTASDTVRYAFISPSSSDDWGRDHLGSEVVGRGATFNVDLSDYGSECVFDIRVDFDDEQDGLRAEARNVNLCATPKITVTGSARNARITTSR